jgi:hypothetical protein
MRETDNSRVVLRLVAGGFLACALSSPALAAGNHAVVGTFDETTNDFPPRADPWRISEPAEYRLKMKIGAGAADPNWKITLTTPAGPGNIVTRTETIDSHSMPATDGTFLSQALGPGTIEIRVPIGAPELLQVEKISSQYFGRSLSIYSPNSVQAFETVTDVISSGGRAPLTATALARAARAMVWLGIEDQPGGQWMSCTGFLITRQLVLTARHCVFPDASQMTLADAASQKPYVVRAWVRELTPTRDLAPTFDNVQVAWQDQKANLFDPPLDAVILQLPSNPAIPVSFTLKLANVPAKATMPLQLLQFTGTDGINLEDTLMISVNTPCLAAKIEPELLFHKCNSADGSSGSPVLDDKMLRGVFAVHSNGYAAGNANSGNVAVLVSRVLAEIHLQKPSLYQTILTEQGEIQ